METEYFFIIFIYRCFKNHPKIILLNEEGNLVPVSLIDKKPFDFEKAKELFIKTTGVKQENCFPSRFFEYFHRFSFEKKKIKYVVFTTSVRLLDEYKEDKNDFFRKGRWFSKEETFKVLGTNKLYRRAFLKEFSQDTFWECLDTRKSQIKKNYT